MDTAAHNAKRRDQTVIALLQGGLISSNCKDTVALNRMYDKIIGNESLTEEVYNLLKDFSSLDSSVQEEIISDADSIIVQSRDLSTDSEQADEIRSEMLELFDKDLTVLSQTMDHLYFGQD